MRTLRFCIKILCLCLALASAAYCFLLYLDLRSYAVMKNLELKNKNLMEEKYKNYHWRSENVFLFMQLSDIHISLFRDPQRVPDLRSFLETELRLIQPELVLVSGDLTDAKVPSHRASQQYEQEWRIYSQLLRDTGVASVTHWMDIRGNHDAFNIGSLSDDKNFFSKYSARGRDNQRSYMHTVRKPYGQYSFIAADVVPLPGAKRPYNFFGFLDSAAALDFQRFGRRSRHSNHSFWFGHYPLSIIVSHDFNLHRFLGQHAYSYMCGHLHTLGGSVPQMYSLHPEGFLELELGDWMDNRLYRIVSVDNDIVSFSDVKFSQFPIVHVSHPKQARYLLPHREPANHLLRFEEIRIFAFSPSGIAAVQVWIDADYIGQAQLHETVRGMFVLPWQQREKYRSGLHTMEVIVRDSANRESRSKHEFTLSSEPNWQFAFMPSLILLGDVTAFFRLVFYSLWLMLFAPLLLLRLARYRFADSIVRSACCLLPASIARGLLQFALTDSLFYPWILYFLYYGCGPLMMGYFTDDLFGVMFLNGLYINGTWIPESFIFISEFIQLSVLHTPLLACLSFRLGRMRCQQQQQQQHSRDVTRLMLPLLLILQFCLSVNFLLFTYGWSVFLLSPCRLWQLLFALHLIRVVRNSELPDAAYRVEQCNSFVNVN